MYTDKVMERFRNPQHVGELEDADGVGTVGNPTCGDVMKVFIKVEKVDKKEILKDIKVKTFGCVGAISSSDMLCEMVKGKSVSAALAVKNSDIVNELEGMPKEKIHCSVLAADALKKAVDDYRTNQEG
jgi:nitrogen fixation NifU-like protein